MDGALGSSRSRLRCRSARDGVRELGAVERGHLFVDNHAIWRARRVLDVDAARGRAIPERAIRRRPRRALRALADHLDGVTAYGRLGEEMAFIKDRLAELAGIVGEALAEPPPAAVAEICRYRAPKAPSA